jgi:hypothetical protein
MGRTGLLTICKSRFDQRKNIEKRHIYAEDDTEMGQQHLLPPRGQRIYALTNASVRERIVDILGKTDENLLLRFPCLSALRTGAGLIRIRIAVSGNWQQQGGLRG